MEEKLREIEKKGHKNEKFNKRISELMQVLRIMQSQYNMIKEILDSSSESIPQIQNKYQFLSEYFIKINSKSDICITVLEISANYIMNNILLELCNIIEVILTKFSQKKSLRHLNDLKIIVFLFIILLKRLLNSTANSKLSFKSFQVQSLFPKETSFHMKKTILCGKIWTKLLKEEY